MPGRLVFPAAASDAAGSASGVTAAVTADGWVGTIVVSVRPGPGRGNHRFRGRRRRRFHYFCRYRIAASVRVRTCSLAKMLRKWWWTVQLLMPRRAAISLSR